MPSPTTQDMSEAIADAILNASGETATRIALRQKPSHTDLERDLGALNRDALIKTIRARIEELRNEQ